MPTNQTYTEQVERKFKMTMLLIQTQHFLYLFQNKSPNIPIRRLQMLRSEPRINYFDIWLYFGPTNPFIKQQWQESHHCNPNKKAFGFIFRSSRRYIRAYTSDFLCNVQNKWNMNRGPGQVSKGDACNSFAHTAHSSFSPHTFGPLLSLDCTYWTYSLWKQIHKQTLR